MLEYVQVDLFSILIPEYVEAHFNGHSIIVLFGGATGDTGKYVITGDSYNFCMMTNKW